MGTGVYHSVGAKTSDASQMLREQMGVGHSGTSPRTTEACSGANRARAEGKVSKPKSRPKQRQPHPLNRHKDAQKTALALWDLGYWPVAIHPRGALIYGGTRKAQGKEPIGAAWGAARLSREDLDSRFWDHPQAGVGICLGPGRAPRGKWLADFEIDGERGEDSLRRLFAGKIAQTLGWCSTRGKHRLYLLNPERLAQLLPDLKELEGRRQATGVYTLPDYPDLELRLGGYKPDGEAKQFQSVVPPTVGSNGKCRRWFGPNQPVEVPEAFYIHLEAVAQRQRAQQAELVQARSATRGTDGSFRWTDKVPQEVIERYGLAALQQECKELAVTAPGTRNSRLNLAAFRLGRLSAAGALEPEETFEALQAAAQKCGLPAEEIALTLASGFEAGKREPRDLSHLEEDGTDERLVNFRREEGDEDEKPNWSLRGLRPGEIDQLRQRLLGDWPRRIDGQLFVPNEDGEVRYLQNPAQLFAYFDYATGVEWARGEGQMISQERYYEHLRATATHYEAVETLPHWPPRERVCYLHPEIPAGDGVHLRQLLAFFAPKTEADRSLLEAFLLTLFWGGRPGQRPAFLFEGETQTQSRGRGSGKSTALNILATALGTAIADAQPTDSIDKLKTRLLSRAGRGVRVGILDNVKTLKFSWGDLEKLITTPVLSGHVLYQGEGQRSNLLTWGITLNGGAFSKDLAQRVIPIHLRGLTEVDYSPRWENRVRDFAREHRLAILGDIRSKLEADEGDFQARTRWATWEVEVLAKTDLPREAQQLVRDRQIELDGDEQVHRLVADYFRNQLRRRQLDPQSTVRFIPNQLAAKWVQRALGTSYDTNRALTLLADLALPELKRGSRHTRGVRGWTWRGPEADPGAKQAALPRWAPHPKEGGGH